MRFAVTMKSPEQTVRQMTGSRFAGSKKKNIKFAQGRSSVVETL